MERESRSLPFLTLCIFNINVIKAVSQTSLPGWREAGKAPRKKIGVCVWGYTGGRRQSCCSKVQLRSSRGRGVKQARPAVVWYPVAPSGLRKSITLLTI